MSVFVCVGGMCVSGCHPGVTHPTSTSFATPSFPSVLDTSPRQHHQHTQHVQQEFDKFGRSVVDFALLGIPAAVVNSGLKFMQKNLELSFQQRYSRVVEGVCVC